MRSKWTRRGGEVGMLIIRRICQMPCIPSQFTDTHGNPLTNKEHHSAHIPRHYVKGKKNPPHYNITTHAVFGSRAHTHTHTQPHTHASTSLQCPSPELSPNICGAKHAQQTTKPCNNASLRVNQHDDFTVVSDQRKSANFKMIKSALLFTMSKIHKETCV